MKKIIYSILLVVVLVFIPFTLSACKKGSNEPYITSLEFYHYPTKTTGYKAYDSFEDDGLMLKANYSDGGFVIVQSGWTYSYIFGEGNNQIDHSDYFYGGETKVKITYQNKSILLNIDEVQKIEQDLTILVAEYSQIKNNTQISLPTENVVITDFTNQIMEGINYELVYCKNFVDFSNYDKTTSIDGAISDGDAPSAVGNYKVFAKIAGNANYKDKYSNVVDFNIIDESTINLLAKGNEEFFAWKEDKKINQPTQSYIQFDIEQIEGNKILTYNSSFAGSGYAMIFEEHITLVNENEKVQLKFENNKIYTNNNVELKKWSYPAYIGTYKKTITTQDALNSGYNLLNNKVCKLEIYVDEEKKDGKTYFKLDVLSISGETLVDGTYNGIVEHSIGQNGIGNLSFQIIEDDWITNLFSINNVLLNQSLSEINIELTNPMDILSNGIYEKF